MTKTEISFTLERFIDKPLDHVFEILTQSNYIEQWSGGRGEVSPSIGGAVVLFDGWVNGKTLEFLKPSKLAYTWLPDDWEDGTQPSEVYFQLEEKNGGTRIWLEHKFFPSQEEADAHAAGWEDYVFGPIDEME